MKKIIKAVAAACMMIVFGGSMGIASADADIAVRMDSVTSEASQYVSFSRVKPIQINDRTLVPARDIAEAAGMEVAWDQPTQTAILTLKADAASAKPIERFAASAISQVQSMVPDMTPVSITAALRLNDSTAVIRYNFLDTAGNNVPVGKKYAMVSKAVFISDGTLMIPIRDSMGMFGLNVDWNQSELCASVAIPGSVPVLTDVAPIANHGEGEYSAANHTDVPAHGAYIGTFKITHYCPCSICNGGWGAYTAWAGKLTPGRSIGVNPNIIPKLTWVYIEGYGYRRAEDTGGGIGEYHIDVAVPDHATAMALGTVYRDVYFAE